MRYPDWVYERISTVLGETDMDEGDVAAVIETIVGVAEKARREGLLAIEDDIDGIESPVLRLGLLLVVDGTDPEIVGETLMHGLLKSAKDGTVLRDTVSIEGVLGVQAGLNPRTLRALLMSFLGADSALESYKGT